MNDYDEHREQLDDIADEIRDYQDNEHRSDEEGWFYADDDDDNE